MTFNLNTEGESPNRITLRLHGRLDAQTFNDFDLAMLDVLPRIAEGGTVVLDLSGLDYISSAGLRSIAKIRRSTRARGGHTLLLNLQPQVRKVFDIVKAVPVNEVFASLQELDDYLDHMQRRMTGQGLPGGS
ncbi:anti-sigma factor antagonist [Dyella solisilvae]|uniref:Anti-sigma factor antagonist n=1 Tax=Dyella solisilvae TaxID=1920168 RepID=A0A370K6D4_9GAMM|nr:STAS domain-containing protein [Dyella solisilvae]RDI98027.1 anti-sigma factor antagonist [Dyella solisilvae]